MIRLICTEVDAGAAANVGGPVNVYHKTFDAELPELEAWLREPKKMSWSYTDRMFTGIELLPPEPK